MIGGRKVAIWLRGGRPFRKIDISEEDCEWLLVTGGILGEVYMDACVSVAEWLNVGRVEAFRGVHKSSL
jgi:hypothetical protein